jgi:cytosine/uracil/thiamine/allantoin permease
MGEYRVYFVLGAMTVSYWFIRAYTPELKELYKKVTRYVHGEFLHHRQ